MSYIEMFNTISSWFAKSRPQGMFACWIIKNKNYSKRSVDRGWNVVDINAIVRDEDLDFIILCRAVTLNECNR